MAGHSGLPIQVIRWVMADPQAEARAGLQRLLAANRGCRVTEVMESEDLVSLVWPGVRVGRRWNYKLMGAPGGVCYL